MARELHAARLELKRERAASAKMFKGAFGAPPARAAGDGPAAPDTGGIPQDRSSGTARATNGHQGLVAMLFGSLWALVAQLVAIFQRLAGGRVSAARMVLGQTNSGDAAPETHNT